MAHVVRLMQWRKRHQGFQLGHRRGIDEGGRAEPHAAVDDAVTDGHDAMPTEHSVAAPGEEKLDGALMSEAGPRRPFLLTNHRRGIACPKPRLGEQSFELPPQHRLWRISTEKHGELQAR